MKDLIVQMKDTSELMIDLAYTAVMYSSREMAEEVLELEDYMNQLQRQARILLVLSGRNREEAEQLQGLFNIVSGVEKISDAADDIATVVTDDLPVPGALRAALMSSQETTARIKAADDTSISRMTVESFESDTGAGTRIIAIRRQEDWLFDPVDATRIEEDDVLFIRGPLDNVKMVYHDVTRDAFTPEKIEGSEDAFQELADTLIEMKDLMELSTGLAYSAVLFDNRELAEEVLALESRADEMRDSVETAILSAASTHDQITGLRGASRIATASEVITDAAMEIATAVMGDTDPHPVLKEANLESDESILRTVVESGSELAGQSLGASPIETELGMTVIAVRQDDRWTYNPSDDLEPAEGDVLILRGPAEHRSQVKTLSEN